MSLWSHWGNGSAEVRAIYFHPWSHMPTLGILESLNSLSTTSHTLLSTSNELSKTASLLGKWMPVSPAERCLWLLLFTCGSSWHTDFNTYISQHQQLYLQNLSLSTCHRGLMPPLQLCTCSWRKSFLPLIESISFQNSLSLSPTSPLPLSWLSPLLWNEECIILPLQCFSKEPVVLPFILPCTA